MLKRKDTLYRVSDRANDLQDNVAGPKHSHHRFGHNCTRVLNLFSHVRDRVLSKHNKHT